MNGTVGDPFLLIITKDSFLLLNTSNYQLCSVNQTLLGITELEARVLYALDSFWALTMTSGGNCGYTKVSQ